MEIISKIKLIINTKGFDNKKQIINYFIFKRMKKCTINISQLNNIYVRENKPNDMYMAMPSDKTFFKYIKQKKFKNIMDIGANIGKYSLLFSENKNSKIFAFEPVNENYNALLRNISKNKIKNIIPIKLGCLNTNSVTNISLCNTNDGAHSCTTKRGQKTEKIKTITIDTFLKNKPFIPDLIKIDIEGAELKALQGCIKTIKKYKPTIYLEILEENQLDKQKIFQFLENKNYKIQDYQHSNYLATPLK